MVDDMSWDHNSVRDCDWVLGCYYLIRKEVIGQVGLFDPRYFLILRRSRSLFCSKACGMESGLFSGHTGGAYWWRESKT
jgi:N-acetylglucosaminyl-diphospho-decaprenol L-rhamnosyltransferase